jgi:hypothetical protein
MNYSLGNMLVNGGALNPDGLALDLQFAADKTLTARKGPTPTFTRASTATFIGSNGLIQSAAINTPRFDHDPTTLASRGLLIEESRTNLALRSEDLGDATWGKTQVTVNTNVSLSPDGLATADKVVENTANNIHRVFRAASAIAGTIYSVSVYAKSDGRRYLYLNAGAFGSNSTFDLQDGVVTATQNGSAQIFNIGNGWYRCVTIGTAPTTQSTSFYLQLNTTTAASDSVYTGDGSSGIFLWGAQLEVGSFPTSYIPTTTASVVRSADVCSITGAAFSGFWNRFAGTCVIGAGSSQSTGGRWISNNLAGRTLEILGSANIDFLEISGVNLVRIATSATYPNTLCLAYAINDYQSAYNGAISGSDSNTGGTIPNPSELHIGNLGGAADRFTGHIEFLRYYKKRLPNSKLQSLTA